VYVNDVVLTAPKNSAYLPSQTQTDRNSSLRSVAVDRLAPAKANHIRLRLSTGDVRCDDIYVMSPSSSLAGEEMHVLADPTQMRIVVLRYERDAK
jgi:hypothetical protein